MAVVLGNLAFLPDTASCRTIIVERRNRPVPFDVVLNLPKREAPPGVSNSNNYSSFSSKGSEFDGECRGSRAGVRGKVNSKVNEVEFDSNSSDEENGDGNGEEEEEDGLNWEARMRKRVKDLEEMKELEKKAEELQGRVEEESKELGIEETEEEKKIRVKKELQKQLEKKHPSVSIRRQAAELRYIMQAPKIKITQEEMVSIPLIGSPYDNYAGTWSDKYKNLDQPVIGSTTNQLPSSRDYLGDILKWKPPTDLEKNRAFWVSVALWLGLIGAALFLQR